MRRGGLAILVWMLPLFASPADAQTPRAPAAEAAPSAEIGGADAALAGHYYLSGVMETGSELLLKPDGRFEWFISYGAVDQVAKGRWGRTGQTVTLVADRASPDTPLVRADQVLPWDAEVERRLHDAARSDAAERIAARCPWGADEATTAMIPSAPGSGGGTAAARAEATKRTAEQARDAATRAIAAAVKLPDDGAKRSAADAAMEAWYRARFAMEQAFQAAGVPVPAMAAPALPPECQPPPREDGAALAPAQWQRAVAVLVGDPARDLRLSNVGVTFVFSDGQRDQAETGRGGWAFAPRRAGAAVDRLVVAVPHPGVSPVTLPIKPLAEGVQTIIVDTGQLTGAPFDRLRLTVTGDDLLPEAMPQGRYARH
ncbi:hypothetical protein ASE57_15695 [Sphingomonas sp. Leaf11]|nr:hypothetical protein ASE58_15695 [Sphingomonas sp. Leaf9]KQM42491.1 hypothetical protein ASE57_15695 [Sphingomonas sp. Leaf11]